MTEMNGQYVNEELYKWIKKKYNVAGIILLVLGVIIAIAGITLTVMGMTNMQFGDAKAPVGMVLTFVGFVALGSGLMLTLRANQRALAAYQAASVAPVKTDTINYVGQNVAPTVEKVSEAVAKGISNATNQSFCPECGQKLPKGSKFCPSCGKKLD